MRAKRWAPSTCTPSNVKFLHTNMTRTALYVKSCTQYTRTYSMYSRQKSGTKSATPLLPGDQWWMKKGWDQAAGWGQCFEFPSVLWHWWLGDRMDIWLTKTYTTSQRLSSWITGGIKVKWNWLTQVHVETNSIKTEVDIIIIIIRKFITRTCSQALSMNRRHGQSLGGLTVCINC